MRNPKKLALLILPDTSIAKDLVSTAQKWIESGLIEDFAYTTPALLGGDFSSSWKLQVKDASDGLDGEQYDLLEVLGQSQPDRLEVVTPWILGTSKSDGALVQTSAAVCEVLSSVLSQRVDPTTGRAIRPLASVAMAIYPFHSEFGADAEQVAASIRSDLIIVCSPEVRAQPWAASAPLQADAQFVPFAIAQISAVCGLWSGFSDSIFAIIDNASDQLAVAQPLVLRTIGSVVVAEGIAERIVVEALRTAALPDSSPFRISSESGSGRPQAISAVQVDLINAEIEKYFNKILEIKKNAFSYDAVSKSFTLDQSRGVLDAIRKFGTFSLKAISNIPIFVWHGVKNAGSALLNRVLGQVRMSHPEIYSGLDREVLDLKSRLKAYLSSDSAMKQEAAAAEAFKQDPEVWRELRNIALSSLDGGVEAGSKSVLPLVANIFPDPRYRIDVSGSEFTHVKDLPSDFSPLGLYEYRRTIAGSIRDVDLKIQELYAAIESHASSAESEGDSEEVESDSVNLAAPREGEEHTTDLNVSLGDRELAGAEEPAAELEPLPEGSAKEDELQEIHDSENPEVESELVEAPDEDSRDPEGSSEGIESPSTVDAAEGQPKTPARKSRKPADPEVKEEEGVPDNES